MIERGMPGFERGRKVEKIGLHGQDTAELYFDDVHVGGENRLGAEGEGFRYLVENLAQERLSIAIAGLAGVAAAIEWTVEHVTQREAFGQPIAALQNTRFTLADVRTELEVGQAFLDRCVAELVAGSSHRNARPWPSCGAPSCRGARSIGSFSCSAATATWRSTRSRGPTRMRGSPRIYGGTSELMREIIARGMGF